MDTELPFGDWLKRRRRGLGLTQVELGHRIGYAGETIRKIEANEARPSVQMAEKLAEALSIPAEERPWFIAFARGEGEPTLRPLPTQTAPVPREAARPRGALPTPLTSFIGRGRELAEIKRLLSVARLVTLTGPGGSGKTRLALEIAHHIDDLPLTIDEGQADAKISNRQSSIVNRYFPDGAFFVDLAPITDPGLILSRVAQTLDVREQPGQPLLETLKDTLREKQTLLLLDNFEQVVEGAPLVAALLAAAPKVRALVTSREALRLRGEHEYPVLPLPAPPRRDQRPTTNDEGGVAASSVVVGPALLGQYPAAALFIERARAVKPDFAVTDANAPAVAEICRRLDGLPLALELAAARVRVLPPEAMLARLDHRMRFLAGGPRDLHTRQQTLQNTIAWSYDLLSPAEQRFFRRLGVFVGGFTVEAAQAVCDADGVLGLDVLDGVESLCAKSLLQAASDGPWTTNSGTVPPSAGAPRFTLLETIREYAAEKLEASGEADTVRAAHSHFFLARAEEAKPHVPQWVEWDWVRRVGVEADNFRAVLVWTGEHGETELFARLAAALWEYWYFARHFSEGEAWTRRGLDHCRSAELARVRADLLLGSAWFAFARGDYRAQKMHAEAYLQVGYELGDDKVVATAYMGLALHAHYRVDDETGLEWAEKALALFRQQGDQLGAAWSRSRAGSYACRLRQYGKAEAYYNEVLAEARAAGWPGMILQAIDGQATLARLQGDYSRAEKGYREVLALYLSAQFGSFANMTLSNLGFVVLRQGRHVEAAALFRECLQCRPLAAPGRDLPPSLTGLAEARAAGWPGMILQAIDGQATLARLQGDYSRAEKGYREVLALYLSAQFGSFANMTLSNLGFVVLRQGRHVEAAALFRECLQCRPLAAPGRDLPPSLTGLAGVRVREGDALAAARLIGGVDRVLADTGERLELEERLDYEAILADIHDRLSDAEFAAAWAEGQAMTREQLVQYALEETQTAAHSNPTPSTQPR